MGMAGLQRNEAIRLMRWLIAALVCMPMLASAQEGFQLPSGNIFCKTEEGAIRCDIVDYSYNPPPKPSDCERRQMHGDADAAALRQ